MSTTVQPGTPVSGGGAFGSEGIRLRLLGQFGVRVGDQAFPAPTSTRVQALLGLLALHADEAQSRSHLAGLLWPDSADQQARTNLRNTLHLLRHNLPQVDRHLEVTVRSLTWRTRGGTVDVREFLTEVERARSGVPGSDGQLTALRAAAGCYTGDLLADLFDECLVDERRRLAETYLDVLRSLTGTLIERREHAEALRRGRELVLRDGLVEGHHQLLMKAYQAAGDRAGALRAYHECAAVLDRELGVGPAPETRRIYAAVARAEPVQEDGEMISGPHGIPLVGRDPERALLGEVVRAVMRGRTGALLITGEPGIGKTRLMEELASWCAQRGVVVARARSYAEEGHLGYGVVVSWLRSAGIASRLGDMTAADRRLLGRVMPELAGDLVASPGGEAERLRLFAAVTGALRLVGRPLLLIADDAHWADGPSIELIHYLIRSLHNRRILVGLTARREELGDEHPLASLIDSLRRADRLTEIALERLDRRETTSLARQLLGTPPSAERLDALYAETEGNPLFVVEAVRAGWDRSSGAELSPRLQAVIGARLRRLSPVARELLAVASCSGGAFNAELLGAVTGAADSALVSGLDQLWRRGVIREHGVDGYDFSHGKIRKVAYDALSPAARRHSHLRIAETLVSLTRDDPDAVSGQVAGHYERAGRPLDAIRWYLRAASRAQHRFADAEAVRQLNRARALVAHLPAEKAAAVELEILSQAPIVVSTVKGYESDELKEVQDRAATLAQSLGQPLGAPLLRSMVMTRLCRDDFARARAAAAELAGVARRQDDAGLEAEATYLAGVGAFWTGDFATAADLLERVGRGVPAYSLDQHLVRFGHDPGVVCLSRLANARWFLGDADAARTICAEAEERAARLGHRYTAAVAGVFGMLLALDLGDDAEFVRLAAAYEGVTDFGFNAGVKSQALLGYAAVVDDQDLLRS